MVTVSELNVGCRCRVTVEPAVEGYWPTCGRNPTRRDQVLPTPGLWTAAARPLLVADDSLKDNRELVIIDSSGRVVSKQVTWLEVTSDVELDQLTESRPRRSTATGPQDLVPVQPVSRSTCVVEFLLRAVRRRWTSRRDRGGTDRQRQLQDRTVHQRKEFQSRARERIMKLIDIMKAQLDEDRLLPGELPSLGIKDVRIADTLVHEHEDADGWLYAEVTLTYDAPSRRRSTAGHSPSKAYGPSKLPVDVLATLRKGRPVHYRRVEGLPGAVRGAGANGDVGPGEDGGLLRHPSWNGTTTRRTWPRGTGKPPIPADIAVLAFISGGKATIKMREYVERQRGALCLYDVVLF